jgi:hypothetical protein
MRLGMQELDQAPLVRRVRGLGPQPVEDTDPGGRIELRVDVGEGVIARAHGWTLSLAAVTPARGQAFPLLTGASRSPGGVLCPRVAGATPAGAVAGYAFTRPG